MLWMKSLLSQKDIMPNSLSGLFALYLLTSCNHGPLGIYGHASASRPLCFENSCTEPVFLLKEVWLLVVERMWINESDPWWRRGGEAQISLGKLGAGILGSHPQPEIWQSQYHQGVFLKSSIFYKTALFSVIAIQLPVKDIFLFHYLVVHNK